MKKKNLVVFQDAVKLTHSGKFKNWKEIEQALLEKGHRRASDLLDGDKIRAVLDAQCALGRKSK